MHIVSVNPHTQLIVIDAPTSKLRYTIITLPSIYSPKTSYFILDVKHLHWFSDSVNCLVDLWNKVDVFFCYF